MSNTRPELDPSGTLPGSLSRLQELAKNLWWSWHPDARRLFDSLDPTLWRLTSHNPVKQLQELKPDRILGLTADIPFVRQFSAVLKAYDEYMASNDHWFATYHGDLSPRRIAYFSAEFGLHNSIPIYSGGLGILAGDHLKEASDLGIPIVGVGFMYPKGYFRQVITPDGWQEALYEPFDRSASPIQPASTQDGTQCRLRVEIAGRPVTVLVWHVQVGRVALYLLDTDIEENTPADRELSARLYGGDLETRISQEIILGVGGVRALRALGITPAVYHANEGHSAFLILERLREMVDQGRSLTDALASVRRTTVFTTHTPVPAGHDVFPESLMKQAFAGFWEQLGLSWEAFAGLGRPPSHHDQGFHMTVLALRHAGCVNGVSREHSRISRAMWRHLWPETVEDEVPIRSITNGVHLPTWIAPEINEVYNRHLGPDWLQRSDDPTIWQRVSDIPDDELWKIRQTLKRKLLNDIRERARNAWIHEQFSEAQVLAGGTLLDPDVLTIGFGRRFATYKRATLLFSDLMRLKGLLHDRWRPVQFIFTGKAHPADEPGRQFIHQVYRFCTDHHLGGHIAFLEDYDMHLAKLLVQGVDVWLNTPRPPMEASGTSGQKAAANGIPSLSIMDGWWKEGYTGSNGWAIPLPPASLDPDAQDRHDANALYGILEQEVVSLYYHRDLDGIPRGWLQVVKDAIRTVAPRFSARRMLKEYVELFYVPSVCSQDDRQA